MIEFIATVLLLVAVVAGVVALSTWRVRWLQTRPRHLETVIVNTRRPDDQSIRGMYYAQSSQAVVLVNPSVLQADGTWGPIAGKAIIPTRNVAWLQKVSAESNPRPRTRSV